VIAALAPALTKKSVLESMTKLLETLAAGRAGIWTEDKDPELKHAVQMHGGKDGKDWGGIAALVLGRRKKTAYE
jgi:hypothetical protein